VVGVNAFREGNDEQQIDLLEITTEDESRQRQRLAKVRHDRDDNAVRSALARVVADAGDPNINLMPALIEAVIAYATLGEIMSSLETEFGRHVEVPVI